MPESDLKEKLTDEQYFITQKKGTEIPFCLLYTSPSPRD